jgi:chemotaxis family two-component system sensor kinase Cph1
VETQATIRQVPGTNVDISRCEQEAIRTPGAVQPHGVLIALHPSDLRIVYASANYDELFGDGRTRNIGQLFDAWFDDEQRDLLEESLKTDPAESNPLHFSQGDSAGTLLATVHIAEPLIIVEFERETSVPATSSLLRMRRAASRLEKVKNLDALCNAVADEIFTLCGYDRVMVYRFNEDWHGQVVAERTAPGVESFLGLHYPASDIPSQARELYRTNWLRYIPDISYRPVELLRSDVLENDALLDLSTAYLRSVSPIHLEYLRNMRVGATLTVSLLQNGRLWGLIALHHQTKREISYEIRSAAEFFGRIVSLQLAAIQENEALNEQIRTSKIVSELGKALSKKTSITEAFTDHPKAMLELLNADGAAVVTDDEIVRFGSTPEKEIISDIAAWICNSRSEEIFSTDALATFEPRFEPCTGASGVVALLIARKPMRVLLWFRKELIQSVTWGGDPHKPVSGEDAQGRISPRKSFAHWTEIQRNRARPWTLNELAGARDLRTTIASLIAQRTAKLEQDNAQLTTRNYELDQFAHIASHDLKEPLRGLHNYASFLIEDYGDVLDDEGRDKLNTLVRLTQRMDHLIESLLQLSRFGRVDFEYQRTNINTIVTELLELFAPRIESRRAHVHVAPNMPLVRADAVRIAEVINNILANALKYSDAAEPHITMGFLPLKPSDTQVTFFVQDNGIGIPARQLRTVFQMFKRLHPADTYGGGTGAGLAIALRIVERHGGKMWIESEPKKGSTVYFTLEIAP